MNSNTTSSTSLSPDSAPSLTGEVFDALPPSVRAYIRYLEATILQLQTRVCDLEARLAKDSSNSSKPPSSDGMTRKPKSQRDKSDKKPGGQQGRVGRGLSQVENPDLIVTHAPTNCHECGSNLSDVNGSCVERRQVFEIPQPKVEVTEHRVEEKKCPCCGMSTRATFPEDVRGPVQYGERVQALTAYFANQHYIPVNRTCEILEDVFGMALSPGTCSNIDERLFQKLDVFESDLKEHLLATRVLHFDETGMRCEKKLYWVHVASSQFATLYTMHPKRGQEAMNEMGILPRFEGIAVHDHWFPYFAYAYVSHGLCNSHHLRELTFIHEELKEAWAKSMKDLLIRAKQEVERHLEQGSLPAEVVLQLEQAYAQIIAEGLEYHSTLPPLPKAKRGRQKQRDGKNLLDRLEEKKNCVLRFMYDFSVPFTNNQAEQDVRMVKLKQKISGCFRKFHGGQVFCRIRSYISTARKQGWNIWGSLADVIRESPRLVRAS
jgi:transposase